jgi:aminoglycoside phosphotransferase (APT) family kinase protein
VPRLIADPIDPVPQELATLLDPVWLARALDDIGEGDRILAVEQVDTSRTLARKVRFRVTVEDAEGGRRTRAYCVKAHFEDDGPGTMAPEAHFYRELAPRVGIRTPRAYYTGLDDDGRALVIMDDVVGNGGRFLGAHEPYSLETTRDSLGQLARLHAATWGDPTPAGCEWLQPRVFDMIGRIPAALLQQLLDDGRAEGLASELHVADDLLEAVARTAALPPTCVLHGDTHSGNVYLDADGRACWLDWQVIQPGHWSTDVSYHLGTVLDVEQRRAHEADLLRHYLSELAGQGVDPPAWDDAWERYTLGFSFGFFLWSITRISSRAVVLLHMPRLGAALTDHDTYRRLGIGTG